LGTITCETRKKTMIFFPQLQTTVYPLQYYYIKTFFLRFLVFHISSPYTYLYGKNIPCNYIWVRCPAAVNCRERVKQSVLTVHDGSDKNWNKRVLETRSENSNRKFLKEMYSKIAVRPNHYIIMIILLLRATSSVTGWIEFEYCLSCTLTVWRLYNTLLHYYRDGGVCTYVRIILHA